MEPRERARLGRGRGIGEYAFISDCQTAALIGPDGSIDWYCVPRFDSPWVLGRLLGAQAGHWLLSPTGSFETARSYVGDSLVLRTTFQAEHGTAILTDALALGPGSRGHDIGLEVPHVLLREVEVQEGDVGFHMEFVPRFEYGLTIPHLLSSKDGVVGRAGPTALHLWSNVRLEPQGDRITASFTLRAGQRADFALSYGSDVGQKVDVRQALADTVQGWESWSELHQGYRGPYRERVRRSALVLQGLTYQPTGGVVAAATSSLPERLGGDANWDYRFVWLRDLTLTMRAQWVAACPHEADRFFRFIAEAAGQLSEGPLQIMFGPRGERELSERTLSHLPGFAGSRPVRVGNAAWMQRQLDVYGEVLDAAHLLADQLQEPDELVRLFLVTLADLAASSWKEPDSGMWEARDRQRHYLTSKVMCWVALDRAIKLAGSLSAGRKVDGWREARGEVREAILEQGWSDQTAAYTGAFGSNELDASVLLMPLVDFLPASDPRMSATIDAIERELAEGFSIRRWEGDSGGFVLCGYWMAECLAARGDLQRAEQWFEGVSSFANDLGLHSEMVEPRSGQPLGNVPQAFSHVGLINAAWRLGEASSAREDPAGGRV